MNDLILNERETKEKLVNVINEAKLPAFVIKNIVKDLFEQLCTLEQKQYEEALNEKKGEKDDKD